MNVVVSTLPNVGSNDHAYLRHVVTHWDSLAPLILLCEAGEPERCSADAVLRPTAERPMLPAFTSHAHDTLMSAHTVVPWKDAHRVFAFSMSEREGYSFHSNREEVHPLVKTGCADFQAWVMSVLGQRLANWFIDNFVLKLVFV